MREIYNQNPCYWVLKSYVKFCFSQFYGSIHLRGLENIPANKSIIYAPNHVNALMDALVVAYLPPFKEIKVFLARSDIFKSDFNRKALKFLKIIPAFRIRDGYENLSKNQESFNTASDVLKNSGTICIMPEGNQGEQHRIRPLVKGIFRIAFNSQLELNNSKELIIVPITIEYEDLLKIKKDIIVHIGIPISIAEYLHTYKINPVKTINEVRNRLKSSLEDNSIHIPEAFDLLEFDTILKLKYALTKGDFLSKYTECRALTDTIKRNYSPDEFAELNRLTNEIFDLSNGLDLRHAAFSFIKSLISIINIPFAIAGTILNAIPFALPVLIRRKMNIKQEGFWTSFHFVLAILIFPVIYLLQSILVLLLFELPFWTIFFLIPFQLILGNLAWKELEWVKSGINQFKWSTLKLFFPKKFSRLNYLISKFNSLVSKKL